MKSPFTGGKVSIQQEKSELSFRKEKYEYTYTYYLCEDTKERFTTTQLDEINILQVYNQYRIKYNIPFPDEIKEIRERYNLSAVKMSKILGFGVNQYRLYENGDMPSETNGKILSLIKNPLLFREFIDNQKSQFDSKEYDIIRKKINNVLDNFKPNIQEQLIFEVHKRSIYNGFSQQSYDKLKNIILYFIGKCGSTFNTKMNKLLFYTDFLSYKTYGHGITGLSYKAIQFGPVPVRWDRVYSLIDGIYPEFVEFSSGNCSTKLCASNPADTNIFNEEELSILNTIINRFKDISASEISKISHKEIIWKKYYGTNELISYNDAFWIKGIKSIE